MDDTLLLEEYYSKIYHKSVGRENVHYHINISIFPGAGDVWFSLSNTTYHNNSLVILEDIGEGNNDALLCRTNPTGCCQAGESRSGIGNWYFPSGARVLSNSNLSTSFYRNRGQMVVRLNRKRGGEDGIYRCVIPDSMNVLQTIYIGVYTGNSSTGEYCMFYTHLFCSTVVIL